MQYSYDPEIVQGMAAVRDILALDLRQLAALRAGQMGGLDRDNLIEEIEDMGKRQKQDLRSRLTVLLMHLLKWQHQPMLQGKSWASTIKIQRFEIQAHLADNPSLKHGLDEIIDRAYQGAVLGAEHETGLPVAAFPRECPWTFEQVMDDGFWPEPPPLPALVTASGD